ncbi:putative F-box protein At1g67623 [Euphorbia lathyris]|uniref:putative F-box protein At1g67623 n=1 Tax=Euphorbia lathyris TaxID=212925 RepID=UPI003313B6B1
MTILSTKKVIKKRSKQNLPDLPTHVLSDILAIVASTSSTDLLNAKASCKEWFKAASEDYVFERVSIESLPVIPWKKTNNGAVSFLQKCIKAGNPESLFRQGMIDYFSNLRLDSGLEYLRKASDKGHLVAKYVYGIILVCYGGEFREQGLKLVCDLKSKLVDECREKVRKVVKFMWKRNFIIAEGEEKELTLRRKNCCCKERLSCVEMKKKSMGWRDEEEFDDGVSCDGCLWDTEAIRFRHMLRTGRFSCRFVY